MTSTILSRALLLSVPFVPRPWRHDDPDGEGTPDPTVVDPGDEPGDDDDADPVAPSRKPSPAKKATARDPEPPADLGDAGKRALAAERERRKAAAADAEAARAELEKARQRIQEFEDAKRSDLEKAQAAAERALERERAANLRAVTSDIRSYAITADALDPSDVVDALSRRAQDFLTDGGVDVAAIEQAVAELLDRKPHWRKPSEPPASAQPAAAKKPQRETPPPAPDPGQGSKPHNGAPDWSDKDTLAAEMRRLGLRSRR